ncbi:MAG: hypothetical protein IKA46_02045 [Clostridia bacterium]|nr:hypothetical protein [Clostridia bacterium]
MEPYKHTPSAQNERFSYTYSAADQEELRRIRKKYAPEEEDKWERLRALDASVTETAQLISLIIGILSALVLGVGLCCVLVWGSSAGMIVLGVLVGIVGLAGVAAAYPVYARISKRQRDRVAPEILRLTEELMKK